MIDRTTKVILVVIAIGLLLNFASPILQPNVAQANPADCDEIFMALKSIDGHLSEISDHLETIAYWAIP